MNVCQVLCDILIVRGHRYKLRPIHFSVRVNSECKGSQVGSISTFQHLNGFLSSKQVILRFKSNHILIHSDLFDLRIGLGLTSIDYITFLVVDKVINEILVWTNYV